MKKNLFSLLCVLLIAGFVYAQPKSKAKPVVKKAQYELEKILIGIGLPYKIVGDSLAVIPYGGDNIKSFQVVIQQISDLYIVLSNLTEAMPGKISESNYQYLLHQNNNFDIVKIGIRDEDNTVAVRADLYKTGTNTALLKRVISQVATVTDLIGKDLNK